MAEAVRCKPRQDPPCFEVRSSSVGAVDHYGRTHGNRPLLFGVSVLAVAGLAAGCGGGKQDNTAPAKASASVPSVPVSAPSAHAPTGSTGATTSSPSAPAPARTSCQAGQVQGTPPQAQGSHNSITGPIYLRNIGPACVIQGFPTVTLLGANGSVLSQYVAHTSDTPMDVNLPASQPPVPTTGPTTQYADFVLSGTNLTRDYQLCPSTRQEQPAALRVAFSGGATFTVANSGTANFGPFSSCDGRIEVSPVKMGR